MERRNETGNLDSDRGSLDNMQMGTGVGQGRPDEDKNAAITVSPGVLLALGAVAAVLAIAAGVCQEEASGEHGLANGWARADYVLVYLSSALYFAGVLVGIATLAIGLSKGVSGFVRRMARILLLGGVAVFLVGIAEVVCVFGQDLAYASRPGSWQVALDILSRLAVNVFYAGVLGGLAYLCSRQQGRPKSSTEGPLERFGD